MQLNRLAEAQVALEAARDINAGYDPEAVEMGETLRSLAYLHYMKGDVTAALREATRAHDILREKGVFRSQALALNLIAIIYRDARDYERALKYYEDASTIFSGDPDVELALQNNIGFAYQAMGNYPAALATYVRAQSIVANMDSPLLKARLLSNIAKAYIAAERWDEATRAIDQAKLLATGANGAGWLPFLYGSEAQIAFAQGDVAKAEERIERAFANQDLEQTTTPFRDFHETAVRLYRQIDKPDMALAHLTALKRLDDEAAAASASANNAILAAEFDFSNQELEISNLRASQLEQQIAASEERAKTNLRITIGILIAAGIIIALILFALRAVSRRRREVGAANVELEKSNADLEKALAAKSEFLATTSHEIRTPLNGILGMTQIMLADADMSHDVRERVQLVHGAGKSMKAIVDDILDVAKMESGTVTIRREPFDLRAAIADVARIFADQARDKGLAFTLDLDDCPRRAIGDEQRVRQVALNLISNAVKFTLRGSVTVRAVADDENSDSLRLTVADTGIGIPATELEEVFTAFHQVDGSRTRNFSGTGLGLTISKELAEAMHGSLEVESIEDRGSTFTLTLPLSLGIANAGERDAKGDQPVSRPVILYAPNALLGMIAARALGGADLDEHEKLADALAAAARSEMSALVLAMGAAGTAADIEALAAFREDHSGVEIYAAGWPADAKLKTDEICAAYVETVPALSQLAGRIVGKDTATYGQTDGILVNQR